jgi:nitroreductase
MEVLEAIKARRSVRRYTADPVDDETVQRVLDAARQAPSWANTQCWRFIVVRDNDIKSKLVEALTPISAERANPATRAIGNAPVVIVACAELGKSGYSHGEPKEPVTDKGDFWYMYDVALAMQNLALTAHSLGLGTVHVGSFDAKKIAAILEVPAGYCVVAMTPLGYPDKETPVRPRKELTEIVFYEKYGLR